MTAICHLESPLVAKVLVELTELPMLLFDADAILLDFNDASLQIYPDLKQGHKLDALKEAAQLLLLIRRCDQVESKNAQSIRHKISDQNERHILWRAKKIIGSDLNGKAYCLVGQDLTYRDQLESELKQSIRHVQDQKMALDESAIVASTDHRGVITYVNKTFCEISGYAPDELIGKTHAVLKSGYHGPDFFRNLWRQISAGLVWKGEVCNRSKSGEVYWVDTTIVPFLGDNGRPLQFIAIRFDITEKKQIQEKLEAERMRSMYAEKMASLGELAAGIAHELGNPAASIGAWLEVIESQYERGALDLEMFMQKVPNVRRDAKRMRDIIRSMLTYARDGSRDPLQSEGVQALLQQVLDYCQYKLRKCGVSVTLSVPNPYLTLDCRLTEITQILVNFVLNACDAVEHLPEKWITITAREVDGLVEFDIIDSGPGIPSDLAEKIFQPFFTTKPVGQGTGLGLSIAQSIVSHHQGSITLDRLSPHTHFKLVLPRKHEEDD